MKTKLLTTLLILVIFVIDISSFAHAASSTVTTIISSEDSYIDSAEPTTNFGSIDTMWIRSNAPTRRSLLRFDLSSIPANAQISSAILKLFVSRNGSSDAGTIYAVNGSWTENAVTYETAPQVGSLIATLPGPASPNSSVSVDITSYILGKSIVDFYILSSHKNGVKYYTRENSLTESPQLIITWTTGSTPTSNITDTLAPTVTPTYTSTPIPTSTPTYTSTSTPTASPTDTLVPTNTPTYTSTPIPTAVPTNTPTWTPTAPPTNTSTLVPTTTPTDAPTPPTSTYTSTSTPTATPTYTFTSIPTNTPSNTLTSTSTATPTNTLTPSITPTNTSTSIPTTTPTNTLTASITPTYTSTSPPTATPTNTPTSTPTATPTISPTSIPTATPTYTSTLTPTNTPTPIPSATPTNTLTPTITTTFTSTLSPTATSTNTSTPTSLPPSSTATVTTPTPNPILTFTPAADAYVNSGNPSSNYGSSSALRVDGSPPVNSYLRFTVQGLGGSSISQAQLLIHANSSSSSGLSALTVADNTWGENTLTYDNAPAMGNTLGTSPPVTGGSWIAFDVTAYVSSEGTFSFVLSTPGVTAINLSSRESGTDAPQLIITTSTAIFTPTNTPTSLPSATPIASPTSQPGGSDPTIVAAGDIICDSLTTSSTACQQMAASQVAVDQLPSAALILGDLCHTPSVDCFDNYYNPSWGRLFSISHPTTGNHDYLVAGAVYYFDYWNGIGNANGPAGDRSQGYYSFDIGTWHIIALNSQCSEAGGCNAGSPQYTWLQQDLQTHSNLCTLAYYHIPVFSSGGRANNNMRQIYTLLYDHNVEVVLNGHDHIYERFAPQDPNGLADPSRGIREFIVGTGGANHTSIDTIQPNSEIRNTDTFGALKLTLHPDGYDWQFIPVAGKTFSDTGTTLCH